MSRKTGLGRGLGALIPATAPAVESVDIDLIVPNPEQPRFGLDPDGLNELAASIREHGVIQPLVVSRVERDHGVTYQLIAGERRLQAARIAGLERVPVVVKEAAGRDLLELALVENLQRSDLNPLEEAQAFRRLVDEFGLTQEAVANRVGRSRTAVANAIRLLSLDEDVKASLARGEISEGHARALLGLADVSQRRRAWREVVDRGLTVRQTEELVRTWSQHEAARQRMVERRRSPDVVAVESRLAAALGTKVSVAKSRKGGRITIHFFSDDELEGFVRRLAGD